MNTVTKREKRTCIICEKEFKEESISHVTSNYYCYECLEKIKSALIVLDDLQG